MPEFSPLPIWPLPVRPPCSCQRTRSTTSVAVKDRGCSQLRSETSPDSEPTSIRIAVQTSLALVRDSMKRSADARKPKVTWSMRSRGGSNSITLSSSCGGLRGITARLSRPLARACTRAPASPKRPRTSSASSAAKSAKVRTPSRCRSAVSCGASSNPTGRGPRNAADSPSGTI